MKSVFLAICLVVILAITLQSAVAGPHREHCECHYIAAKKGCRIGRGSVDMGYKCQCTIRSWSIFTSCHGARIQCNTGETCPAGCLSKECCEAAGGNCGGY